MGNAQVTGRKNLTNLRGFRPEAAFETNMTAAWNLEEKIESAGDICGGDCWTLRYDWNEGPCCPGWTAPAKEIASYHKAQDRGWDPCCFGPGPCDINAAQWDGSRVVDANGQQWYGYVYDNCPCDPNEDYYNCANTENSETGVKEWLKPECIRDADRGDADGNWMRSQCGTEGSKDICWAGFIPSPLPNGDCIDNYAPGPAGVCNANWDEACS